MAPLRASKGEVIIRVVAEATKKEAMMRMASTISSRTTVKTAREVTGSTSKMISSMMAGISDLEETARAATAGTSTAAATDPRSSYPISESTTCTMSYFMRPSSRRRSRPTNLKYSCS